MKLFAGFFFDLFGVRLQAGDLVGIGVVLFLKFADLLLQILILSTFSAIDSDPVRTQHSVNKYPDGNYDYSGSCQATTHCIHLFHEWSHVEASFLGPSLGVVCALYEGAHSLFGRRDDADFRKSYSKIHCLAAALSFCNSCALGASEYALTTGSVPEIR